MQTPLTRLASASALGAMQTPIVHCPLDATITEVARLMSQHRIHCVATGGMSRDRVRGLHLVWALVTDTDLARAALAGDDDLTAGDIAASEVIAVDPSDTLDVVAHLMEEHEATHVVVVADGEPVGVISTLDVARVLAAEPGTL